MTNWSERNLERSKKRKEIRIQEAAQATIMVLEKMGCNKPGMITSKKVLFVLIPEAIAELRKNDQGIIVIPTVDNKAVKIATRTYLKYHWAAIRDVCERYGYFIVWHMPGEPKGLRLGTAEEKQMVQEYMFAMAQGLVTSYNEADRKLEIFGENEGSLELVTEQV